MIKFNFIKLNIFLAAFFLPWVPTALSDEITLEQLFDGSSSLESGSIDFIDSSNNLYLFGDITEYDGYTLQGSRDLFVSQFSNNGSLYSQQWVSFSGAEVRSAYGTGTGLGSFLYQTGQMNGDITGQASQIGQTDIFLGKFSNDGDKIFEKLLGTTSQEQGYDITSDGNQYLYLIGSTQGSMGSFTNHGNFDPFIKKLDADGNEQWSVLLNGPERDWAHGIHYHSDDAIYITGMTNGTIEGEASNGGRDGYLTKFNSSGTIQWTQMIGGSGTEAIYGAVSTDSSGTIYLVGITQGDIYDIEHSGGGWDGFISKYDSDGNRLWSKSIATTGADIPIDVLVASDGYIYATGRTNGNLNGQTNNGNYDGFLVKYDSDGNLISTALYGDSNWNDLGFMVEGSDGYIYITGGVKFFCESCGAISTPSTTFDQSWAQPYAAMQNVGLKSIHNNRDLVLAKAGECNNSGWVIEDTDYCVYTNVKNKVSYVNGDTTRGSYGSAIFNGSINLEKTINDKWKAGIAYGMGSANLYDFSFSGTTANLNSSNNHYSVYGVKKVNEIFTLKGMVGGSVFDYKGSRSYSTTSATSAYESDGYTAEVNGTWDIKKEIKNSKNSIRLQPMVGIAFAAHAQDGFDESGSGDLITLESNQAESLLIKTGINVDKQILMEGGKWLLVPSVALNYEMDTYAGDRTRDIKGKVTGSSDSSTSVEAKTFGQHRGSVKVGADFVMNKDFMFNLNAEYGLATDGDENSYGGGFRYQF